MQVLVDCRESSLLNQMNAQNLLYDLSINIVSKNLNLGDIVISDVSENPIVIIERKTPIDLAASIKDGRFKEQSERLINSISLKNHNIIYLIEGNMSFYNEGKGRLQKRCLWSAITDLNYFKGFSIYNTVNVSQTAEFILRYFDKLNREFKNGKLEYEKVTYDETLKSVKKENVNKDNIGKIMLSQIPGVSAKISSTIMASCVNLKNLIDKCENDTNFLYSLKTIDKNEKSRKISKKTIDKIIEYLS